ncbi:MAG: phage holin family protein [Methylotenera sp.]|jgi:putative membrane protein|nr:phage holin family protein [Methylotenera sp.]HOY87636.1 phage holin family protein [Methylotenera sp.]HPH08824.1 phage holin family protein [Methylotenera sp.]HPM50186.1 phage holin family protein [Methylotenera sp.]HPV31964.1 phage holin family protein [Methylotenera sp.]
MKLLLAWVLNALALLAVAYLIPEIHVANFITALIAAVFIGLANILIKPILTVLTLPITIITLGLFILVINGLLFYAVGNLLQGFEVTTFTAGIIGAIAYSIISWLLSALLIEKD